MIKSNFGIKISITEVSLTPPPPFIYQVDKKRFIQKIVYSSRLCILDLYTFKLHISLYPVICSLCNLRRRRWWLFNYEDTNSSKKKNKRKMKSVFFFFLIHKIFLYKQTHKVNIYYQREERERRGKIILKKKEVSINRSLKSRIGLIFQKHLVHMATMQDPFFFFYLRRRC